MEHKINYISLNERNFTLSWRCKCGAINKLKREEPGFNMWTDMSFKCKEDKNSEIKICDTPGCDNQVDNRDACWNCLSEIEHDRYWEKKEEEFISELTFDSASDECKSCGEEECEDYWIHSDGKYYVRRDCEPGEGTGGYQYFMTKEQFIKRVEEITGMKYRGDYDFEDENLGIDFEFAMWFGIEIKKDYTPIQLHISKNTFEFRGKDFNHRFSNKWLIPLGEAIKEYYETN